MQPITRVAGGYRLSDGRFIAEGEIGSLYQQRDVAAVPPPPALQPAQPVVLSEGQSVGPVRLHD